MSKFTEDFKDSFMFKPSDWGSALGILVSIILAFVFVLASIGLCAVVFVGAVKAFT